MSTFELDPNTILTGFCLGFSSKLYYALLDLSGQDGICLYDGSSPKADGDIWLTGYATGLVRHLIEQTKIPLVEMDLRDDGTILTTQQDFDDFLESVRIFLNLFK